MTAQDSPLYKNSDKLNLALYIQVILCYPKDRKESILQKFKIKAGKIGYSSYEDYLIDYVFADIFCHQVSPKAMGIDYAAYATWTKKAVRHIFNDFIDVLSTRIVKAQSINEDNPISFCQKLNNILQGSDCTVEELESRVGRLIWWNTKGLALNKVKHGKRRQNESVDSLPLLPVSLDADYSEPNFTKALEEMQQAGLFDSLEHFMAVKKRASNPFSHLCFWNPKGKELESSPEALAIEHRGVWKIASNAVSQKLKRWINLQIIGMEVANVVQPEQAKIADTQFVEILKRNFIYKDFFLLIKLRYCSCLSGKYGIDLPEPIYPCGAELSK